jgi:hypothetical protein
MTADATSYRNGPWALEPQSMIAMDVDVARNASGAGSPWSRPWVTPPARPFASSTAARAASLSEASAMSEVSGQGHGHRSMPRGDSQSRTARWTRPRATPIASASSAVSGVPST